MQPRLYFFIGKGGVGKSTTAALCALQLANGSRDTLLVSLDPAHNLHDIFEVRAGDRPRHPATHLTVREIDTEAWARVYLKRIETDLKQIYGYQRAFNLESYFNVLRFSPGLEEYALLAAFQHLLESESRQQAIVFDMPPTALALRFFSLPFITLTWLAELLKLRTEICRKKAMVSRITRTGSGNEPDRVTAKLESLSASHTLARARFRDASTAINLVLNPERLSLAESCRIKQKLSAIGLSLDRVVVNKCEETAMSAVQHTFHDAPVVCLPLAEQPLFGLDALNAYLRTHAPSLSRVFAAPCATALQPAPKPGVRRRLRALLDLAHGSGGSRWTL